MRIRPASPTDADAIHRVSVASCRAAYGDVVDDAFIQMVAEPSRVETLEDRLVDAESADPVVYLVAETPDTGTVVGFVQVLSGTYRPEHVDPGAAYLKSLYVHPDRWREGIGSDLLAESLARLPASISHVRLGVLSANDAGKRFYEVHGFERVDTGSFDVGAVTYDTEIYARELP